MWLCNHNRIVLIEHIFIVFECGEAYFFFALVCHIVWQANGANGEEEKRYSVCTHKSMYEKNKTAWRTSSNVITGRWLRFVAHN